MHQGHLVKAAVELAKDWRTDRMLRKLEALLAVADETASLIITGNGDVVQPENDLIAIGSGGPYAQAAARALLENTELSAREIAEKGVGYCRRHLHLYQPFPHHRRIKLQSVRISHV